MPRSLPPIHLTDSQDVELAQYRKLPGQAVLALLFGLLSPVAIIDWFFWVVPVVGVFFAVWAIRKIKKNPSAMAGRKRAIFGLTLSLLSLAAAPTDWFVYRRIVHQQAVKVADTWFKFALENQVQRARKMSVTVVPTNGPPQLPVLPKLVELGPRAQVQLLDTIDQSHEGNEDSVVFAYGVAFEEAGERKWFQVRVVVTRAKLPDDNIEWCVLKADNGLNRP